MLLLAPEIEPRRANGGPISPHPFISEPVARLNLGAAIGEGQAIMLAPNEGLRLRCTDEINQVPHVKSSFWMRLTNSKARSPEKRPC